MGLPLIVFTTCVAQARVWRWLAFFLRLLKTPKGLSDFLGPENAEKGPFQAHEIAKFCQFKAPKTSMKVLSYYRPLRTPKKGCFRPLKQTKGSRDCLCWKNWCNLSRSLSMFCFLQCGGCGPIQIVGPDYFYSV